MSQYNAQRAAPTPTTSELLDVVLACTLRRLDTVAIASKGWLLQRLL